MHGVLQFFLSMGTIENASAELLAQNLCWVFVCDITSSLAWLWRCELKAEGCPGSTITGGPGETSTQASGLGLGKIGVSISPVWYALLFGVQNTERSKNKHMYFA